MSENLIELDTRLTALETAVTRMEPVFRDMLNLSTLLNERLDTHADAIKTITDLMLSHPTEPIDNGKVSQSFTCDCGQICDLSTESKCRNCDAILPQPKIKRTHNG